MRLHTIYFYNLGAVDSIKFLAIENMPQNGVRSHFGPRTLSVSGHFGGATDNAETGISAPSKMQGWKMRDQAVMESQNICGTGIVALTFSFMFPSIKQWF